MLWQFRDIDSICLSGRCGEVPSALQFLRSKQLSPPMRKSSVLIVIRLTMIGIVATGLASGCGEEPESTSDTANPDTQSSAVAQEEDSLDGNRAGEASSGHRNSPGGQDSLNAMQKKRLGPALRRLLTGDTLSRPGGIRKTRPVGEREGEQVYSVLIEGADTGTLAGTLQDANIPLVSAAGGVVTARLTADQIRRAASIEDVRRIRFPGQATPQ